MPKNMSSPVQKRAVTADTSSAGASATHTTQDMSAVVSNEGHESSHATLIDSQKVRDQNSASNLAQATNNQTEKKNLKFSVQAILEKEHNSNKNRDSRKNQDSRENRDSQETGVLHNPDQAKIVAPDSKLECLINRNTGQMSHSGVQSAVRPQSYNANGITLHRYDAVQERAFAETLNVSQTAVPPGFEAAAAAAAVAAADSGAHTATPWPAAATAKNAATIPHTRPATPWSAAAANTGAVNTIPHTRPATPWPAAAADAGTAPDARAHPETSWSAYNTQPYIQPIVGGSNSMAQTHHPSMTVHYMPSHGFLVPVVHGHGLQPPTMTRMPPPQPLLSQQLQPQPLPLQMLPPPPLQAHPPPSAQPPLTPLTRQGTTQTIRCIPSERLIIPKILPGTISNDMTGGHRGHSLPTMLGQNIQQFPACKSNMPKGQQAGQIMMQNRQDLNANRMSTAPMNIVSPTPPMPPLMHIQRQNVGNSYRGQNVGQKDTTWPTWSPLLPNATHSTSIETFSSPSGLTRPFRERPRLMAPTTRQPPPPPLMQAAPLMQQVENRHRIEALQQRQMPPPAQPPKPPETIFVMSPSRAGSAQRRQDTGQSGRRKTNPNISEMTSQLAAMKSISRAMKQFGPRRKSNRKKASNANYENSEPENIIAHPDVDQISTSGFDEQELDSQISDISDTAEDNPATDADKNFKAKKLSSLQLRTARSMLDKELKELQRKKMIDMFMDKRTKTSIYTDYYEEHNSFSPLFLAAYIISTPGCHDVFICKCCNKEVELRQGFRKHNNTKTHLKNLKEWVKIVEMNDYEDDINKNKRKISKAAIRRTIEAIEKHQEIHDLAKTRFYVRYNNQLIAQDVQEEDQIEMVDLTQQFNEQEFCAFNKITQAIQDLCPGQFEDMKKQLIRMISVMFFDKDKCDLQIKFNIPFYEAKKPKRHWIPKFFEQIKRRSNPRHFMQRQWEQKNLSFAEKSKEQLEEIKTICGMARMLFPIFLECTFVPNSYVILLAVLMDTRDGVKCEDTSTRLKNGWIIDLILRSGVAILDPTTDVTPMVPTEPEIAQNQQEDMISDQTEPIYHIQLPDSIWPGEGAGPSSKQPDQESVFTTEKSPETFLSSAGVNIESDLLLNQTRIQEDIELNKTEVNMEAQETSKPYWSMDSDIYQKSDSSYSSTTSIQSIPGEETNEIIKEHDLYLDNDETINHEIEVSHIKKVKNAIICVPNLPKHMTEKSLNKLFKVYGPIKKMEIESSKNLKFRNGLITFFEHENAVSAMISMNNTIYKHKQFNIVMSKRKQKLLRAFQNRQEKSPLGNLTSMVSNLEAEPEMEILHPDPGEDTVNTTYETLTDKKKCKRKIKAMAQTNTTKSSKPDMDDALNEEQEKIMVEIDLSSGEEQLEQTVEFHTDAEQQDSPSSRPPDPVYLANCLFTHWEDQLHFHEDVERTNNGAFSMETINQLVLLVDKASSNRQTE